MEKGEIFIKLKSHWLLQLEDLSKLLALFLEHPSATQETLLN